MKIEHVEAIKNIPQKQQSLLLKQGEIFVSEVLEVKGETALLRSQQNMLLTARLLGDLGLTTGDRVETVVDGAGEGRYVLRVVDISRNGTQDGWTDQSPASDAAGRGVQTLYNTLTMLKKNAGLDPKTAAFLAKNGIADTAGNVETLGQLAKGEEKAAGLLTQMRLIVTTEKAAAGGAEQAQAPAAEPSLAAAAARTESPATAGETAPAPQANAETPLPAQGQPAAANPAAATAPQANAETPLPVQGQPAAVNPAAATALQANVETPLPAQSSQPAAAGRAAGAVVAEQSAPAVPSGEAAESKPLFAVHPAASAATSALPADMPEQGTNGPSFAAGRSTQTAPGAPSLPDVPEQAAAAMKTAGAGVPPERTMEPAGGAQQAVRQGTQGNAQEIGGDQFFAPKESMPLARLLISMFVDLKDRENLAGQIKKTVSEQPEQIKQLKILLSSADSMDRDKLTSKAAQLEKQLTLMSEVKRFDCYHIPLANGNREPSTAELYVYRQRRRKSGPDAESFVVLLGLDTQHMGRVETMVRATGRSVALEFRLEQKELDGVFTQNAEQLKPLIEEAGYQLSGISVSELAAKTTVLTAEDVLSKGMDAAPGGLDVRI